MRRFCSHMLVSIVIVLNPSAVFAQNPVPAGSTTAQSRTSGGKLAPSRRGVSGSRSKEAYQSTLLRHLTNDPPPHEGTFAARPVSIIERWHNDFNYQALHAALEQIPFVQAIGVESSGDAGNRLESIWVGDVGGGNCVVASLRRGSIIVAPTTQTNFKGLLEITDDLQTRRAEMPHVQIARHSTHPTTYGLILLTQSEEQVRVYQEFPTDTEKKWTELVVLIGQVDDSARRSAWELRQ